MKNLRSFMGEINQMNRVIPALAHLFAPLRPLLRKDNKWKWDEEHEDAFKQIESAMRKITKIKHFQRDVPTRIICDACKEGLGTILQQKQNTEWETTHYASRLLTEYKRKYSINELEFIAVV